MKTLPLSQPFEFEGRKIDKLELRHGTLGDAIELERFEGGELESVQLALSLLSGLSTDAVAKIGLADLKKHQGVVQELLGNDLDDEESGPTSSSSSADTAG